MTMKIHELLADYAALMNLHGAESREASEFFAAHESDADFANLAQLSKKLLIALTASKFSLRSSPRR